MTKQISITLSEFVFETYLSDIEENRSRYIEKLIVLGSESLLNEDQNLKIKQIKLLKNNQNLVQEFSKLKKELNIANLTISNLKSKFQTREQKQQEEQELQLKNAITRGLRDEDSWKG